MTPFICEQVLVDNSNCDHILICEDMDAARMIFQCVTCEMNRVHCKGPSMAKFGKPGKGKK